jgi:hypothetical protein
MHNGKPLWCVSVSLSLSQRNTGSKDRESLAAKESIKKLSMFFWGREHAGWSSYLPIQKFLTMSIWGCYSMLCWKAFLAFWIFNCLHTWIAILRCIQIVSRTWGALGKVGRNRPKIWFALVWCRHDKCRRSCLKNIAPRVWECWDFCKRCHKSIAHCSVWHCYYSLLGCTIALR